MVLCFSNFNFTSSSITYLCFSLFLVCDVKCDLQGCVNGSISECCHDECLGGCQTADSTFSCNACKNYRIEAQTSSRKGECVNKCPDSLVLVSRIKI